MLPVLDSRTAACLKIARPDVPVETGWTETSHEFPRCDARFQVFPAAAEGFPLGLASNRMGESRGRPLGSAEGPVGNHQEDPEQ